jgi:hypothetical protein
VIRSNGILKICFEDISVDAQQGIMTGCSGDVRASSMLTDIPDVGTITRVLRSWAPLLVAIPDCPCMLNKDEACAILI